MIISASYKTDIPAFYGKWFMARLRAGYCKVVNPFNQRERRVSLLAEDIDGIVFWTKNLAPFWHHLQEIKKRDYEFIVQYTINGYPKKLEYSVVDCRRSIEHFKKLSGTFGPKVGVWRYDPIVFSTETSEAYHKNSFEFLAKSLEGTTDEVVVSFAQIYRKTLRNMNWAAEEFDFQWQDPSDECKYTLAKDLAAIAAAYGMKFSMCSQKQYLAPGVSEAVCIDGERLEAITGKPLTIREKGNRPDCRCHESIDIGSYDSCPHGCVYCYAVQNREKAVQRFTEHDPDCEFLVTPNRKPGQQNTDAPIQLELFKNTSDSTGS